MKISVPFFSEPPVRYAGGTLIKLSKSSAVACYRFSSPRSGVRIRPLFVEGKALGRQFGAVFFTALR